MYGLGGLVIVFILLPLLGLPAIAGLVLLLVIFFNDGHALKNGTPLKFSMSARIGILAALFGVATAFCFLVLALA
jgi:hypothetical protein